ncbi:DUF4259 domain-containing protein [Streptomyces sp. ISL-36]|uniref:DUF4259 domain-containing protein n=1 Tax=Streptomyces sp. ISL-36 TaxID=2819182 RepID=UPI001BE8D2AD|nr:DUF4259 domain-containing protein [Streptomyces sp. ISL-36]MBT2444632.1 DUF4259 domain-containing protein [Streptomyces sp. ISL-36]
MGTWDIGHFDNDTAADFSGDLDDLPAGERAALLSDRLREVAGTGDAYLDADVAVEAVAAAALIAAQCPGGEPVTTPYGPDEPLPELPTDLRPLAVEALDRVLTGPSELLELWGETEHGEPWKAGIVALRGVLTAAGGEHTSLAPGRR